MPTRREQPDGGRSLILTFADETEESFTVQRRTTLKAAGVKEGWWQFKLLDGRELAYIESELRRIDLGGSMSLELPPAD